MKGSKQWFGVALAMVLVSVNIAWAANLTIQTRVNGVVTSTVPARALSLLELGYLDLNGRAVSNFTINHEKPNHAIIVSESLESFAHVHPDLQRTGLFTLRLNDRPASYDADNQDAARAIPKGGNYFVFTEVQPRGARASEIVATGLTAIPAEAPIALVPDPMGPGGKIVKHFRSDLQPGAPGEAFRVTLEVERLRGMTHFNYVIEERTATGYTPLPVLENWLGMPGHAILISQAPGEGSRVFRHMHFGHGGHGGGHGGHGGGHTGPVTGADVQFMLEGRDIPTIGGLYKIWAQVKYRGRVLTFPAVFRL